MTKGLQISALFSEQQISLFEFISTHALQRKFRVFLVGGVVRDLFLDKPPKDRDIDFLVEGNAIDFCTQIHGATKGKLRTFADFYTAKIVNPTVFEFIDELDFASSRTEVYSNPGALPDVVLSDIEHDLKRRDFTINSMALPINKVVEGYRNDITLEALAADLLDPFHGLLDLKERKIKVLHPESFLDDPTRIFRAVRYETRISGGIEPSTESLLIAAVKLNCLETISQFRILQELKKICLEPDFDKALYRLNDFGVLALLDLFEPSRTSHVLEAISFARRNEAEHVFDFLLRVFWSSLGEGRRVARFTKLGFGKKTFKKIERELEESKGDYKALLSVSGH